jgi:glycosyltransferase involved in cell wall biosynthesis
MIPNDDVISLMKSCDFFVMPSEKVVFDMVILEALASGITVIASNHGGNKEIIKNSINGYLIDTINPEMFAKKIITSKKIFQPKGVISSKSMYNDYNSIYQNILLKNDA